MIKLGLNGAGGQGAGGAPGGGSVQPPNPGGAGGNINYNCITLNC